MEESLHLGANWVIWNVGRPIFCHEYNNNIVLYGVIESRSVQQNRHNSLVHKLQVMAIMIITWYLLNFAQGGCKTTHFGGIGGRYEIQKI